MTKLVSGKIVKMYGYMSSKRKNNIGTVEYIIGKCLEINEYK